MGAIPGSRKPSPSSTGLGPSGFDPERLRELAERCERAVFPCIDDAAAAELASIRSAICHLMLGRGYDAYSPDFTASLDAAVTLVPEGCSPWHCGKHNKSGKHPRTGMRVDGGGDAYLTVGTNEPIYTMAATPALALCAAALKARAASADTHRNGGDAKQAPFMSGAVGSEADETPQ